MRFQCCSPAILAELDSCAACSDRPPAGERCRKWRCMRRGAAVTSREAATRAAVSFSTPSTPASPPASEKVRRFITPARRNIQRKADKKRLRTPKRRAQAADHEARRATRRARAATARAKYVPKIHSRRADAERRAAESRATARRARAHARVLKRLAARHDAAMKDARDLESAARRIRDDLSTLAAAARDRANQYLRDHAIPAAVLSPSSPEMDSGLAKIYRCAAAENDQIQDDLRRIAVKYRRALHRASAAIAAAPIFAADAKILYDDFMAKLDKDCEERAARERARRASFRSVHPVSHPRDANPEER